MSKVLTVGKSKVRTIGKSKVRTIGKSKVLTVGSKVLTVGSKVLTVGSNFQNAVEKGVSQLSRPEQVCTAPMLALTQASITYKLLFCAGGVILRSRFSSLPPSCPAVVTQTQPGGHISSTRVRNLTLAQLGQGKWVKLRV